jgi:hypothetical protein
LLQISGHTETGVYLLNATWQVDWQMKEADEAPLIEAVALKNYNESRTPAELLADATADAVGETPHWREQFLTGTEQWCARIDASAGANQYAHNGLAIGDVDNDGREDLYVCQMGGLPNRLFRQNADGNMTDIAPANGVDWLDESRGAQFIDVNNDGWEDIFVPNGFMTNERTVDL